MGKPKTIRNLSNVVTTRILPSVPREPSYMELSNLDLLLPPYHTPVLLFYKPEECGGSSFSKILHTLKTSLSDVLITFYPMAGQLENTGADGYSPILFCDGRGAVFTEACISLELDDLIHDNFEPCAFLSGMDAAQVDPGVTYNTFSVPVLIVQVTCFECGGVAVGVNWHHSVADGISGSHFMKSWAEVARGEKISLLPCHNRALVKAGEPALHSGNQMDVDNIICLERSVVSKGTEQVKANSTTLFRLSEKKLNELKAEALMTGSSDQSHFTSLDCVSAHLWRCFTKAKGLRGEDITAFKTYIDGRRKMDPPLPQGYFGNAVTMGWARTTAGELLNGPLSLGAGLIHDAICGVTGESFQKLIDWKERHKETTTVLAIGSSVEDGHKFGISSWKHFGLYDVDFGFGRPVFAVRNGLPSATLEGLSFWLPSCNGSPTIQVYLHPHSMANLLAETPAHGGFKYTWHSPS